MAQNDQQESSNGKNPGAQFVRDIIADRNRPVVVFSLSWCAYCRAVKQLFDQLGVPYSLFDVDTAPYQQDGLYDGIRAELYELTGQSTLPQVFVGSEAVGGFTETQSACSNGGLKALLEQNGVSLS